MPEAEQSLTGVSEDVVAQDNKRPAALCTHTQTHTHKDLDNKSNIELYILITSLHPGLTRQLLQLLSSPS